MAALWKLPVVYVIENNRYGMGTSVARASASPNLFERGIPYGIPGRQVDGMNVLAVRAAAEEAFGHARDGKGPVILEMLTYRYRGHSMSDPAKYRTREEVSEVRETRDPIDFVRDRLLKDGVGEDGLKQIDREIRDVVNDAAEFAQQSSEPDPAELWTDVLKAA
jgi:pyruvate dehydrogenase E1 component alpha subunit